MNSSPVFSWAINAQGYTALHVACEAGDLRCLAALVDGGGHLFSTTVTGANAAHLAVTARRRDVLRFLCEADAEERRLLQSRDRAGRTPLELCVDEDVRPTYTERDVHAQMVVSQNI
jgi:hypothetical protein